MTQDLLHLRDRGRRVPPHEAAAQLLALRQRQRAVVLDELVDEVAMSLGDHLLELPGELVEIHLARAVVLRREHDVDAVRLVADVLVDPLELHPELLDAEPDRAEHSEPTGLAHRDHDVTAVRERVDRDLDAKPFGQFVLHGRTVRPGPTGALPSHLSERVDMVWALRRRTGVGLLVVAISLVGGLAAAGAQDGPADPTEALADRFAPVMMLKAQTGPCDRKGERFAPMAVDVVLDNSQVLLRQIGAGDPTVERGPGGAQLFDLGGGFYLDYPGDALDPGCLYEQDFHRFADERPATVYAHVVADEAGDRLALQYWFFWYFNDWNNTHEGDWEGIQLVFDVGSVEEALRSDPVSVGYAQHEGGERAGWDEAKLERRGDHPVVYSSAGSHASYYGSALHLDGVPPRGSAATRPTGLPPSSGPPSSCFPTRSTTLRILWPGSPSRGTGGNGTGPVRRSDRADGEGPLGRPVHLARRAPDDERRRPRGDRGPTRHRRVLRRRGVGVRAGHRRPGAPGAARAGGCGRRGAPAVPGPPHRVDVDRVHRHRAPSAVRSGRPLRVYPRAREPSRAVDDRVELPAGRCVDRRRDRGAASRARRPGVARHGVGDRHRLGRDVVARGQRGARRGFVFVTAAVTDLLTAREHDPTYGPGAALRHTLGRARDLAAGAVRVALVVGLLVLTVVGIPWAVRRLVDAAFFPQLTALGDRPHAALAHSGQLVVKRRAHGDLARRRQHRGAAHRHRHRARPPAPPQGPAALGVLDGRDGLIGRRGAAGRGRCGAGLRRRRRGTHDRRDEVVPEPR
ncbi:MAG: hypothetical protein R2695_22205 [Acidimicrobiales bacterium]